MKHLLYPFILLTALCGCYKENGEPLRVITEFELGTKYDTIPCQSTTTPNQATFGDGTVQNFAINSYSFGLVTRRIFNSDPYQFEINYWVSPDQSAYFTTTSIFAPDNGKSVRLYVSKRNPSKTYICEPGKKVYLKFLPNNTLSTYFCGGTFFNRDDNTDSVVVSHVEFLQNL